MTAHHREAFVEGISFWASRLPGWELARHVLCGRAEPPATSVRRPAPDVLPPAERRRAPDTVSIAVEVAGRACRAAAREPAELAGVFATMHGDLSITDGMCATLARAPLHTSPTQFHNSVHNAPAGYWCIATGCRAAYTTVSVSRYSYGVGLLEACVQACSDGPVLYVAYDTEATGPLAKMATSRGLLGAGLVLAPERRAAHAVRLSWSVRGGDANEATRADPRNAALVEGNAMAGCLPLFEALARRGGRVTLALGPEYLLDAFVHDGTHVDGS